MRRRKRTIGFSSYSGSDSTSNFGIFCCFRICWFTVLFSSSICLPTIARRFTRTVFNSDTNVPMGFARLPVFLTLHFIDNSNGAFTTAKYSTFLQLTSKELQTRLGVYYVNLLWFVRVTEKISIIGNGRRVSSQYGDSRRSPASRRTNFLATLSNRVSIVSSV